MHQPAARVLSLSFVLLSMFCFLITSPNASSVRGLQPEANWSEVHEDDLDRSVFGSFERPETMDDERSEKRASVDRVTFEELIGARQTVSSFRGLESHDEIRPATAVIHAQAIPGANVRVNSPAFEQFGRAQSESSIGVNGQNIVVSFNDNSNGQIYPDYNISGYSYSTDGGNTFVHTRLPQPNASSGFPAGGSNFGDGVVAFGPDGDLYYATLVTTSTGGALGVARSTNNGVTFTPPNMVYPQSADKEWVAVDRGSRSPYRGNLYLSWTNSLSSISFARSTDRGMTFSARIILSPNTFPVQGSRPAR